MDINALVSRDRAYFNNTTLTMYLPELSESLACSVVVEASDTSSLVTITAPFNPSSNTSIGVIEVLEKLPTEPVEYATTWLTVDTATLTPNPSSVQVGQQFTIGQETYEVASIAGNDVTFTTPVSQVAVFYASVATPDVSYQWQLSEDGGNTWLDIPGATNRSYEPVTGDVGDNLRVIVSYVDGQGTVEEPSLAPPETQPQFIYPVFPVVASVTLDVVRAYSANLLAELIVTLESS